MDKNQAARIVHEIADLNSRLHHLPDVAEQEHLQLSNLALLRDVISRTSTAAEVEQIRDLIDPGGSADVRQTRAAAVLKRIRLAILGADRREDEERLQPTEETRIDMPQLRHMKLKKLTPHKQGIGLSFSGLEPAYYDGVPVLVEWKVAELAIWDEVRDHVRGLALLLGGLGDGTFHSLNCIGYLSCQEHERFGLIFDMSDPTESPERPMLETRTLYDLKESVPHVSLDRRLVIATALSEAILQLHTAGWLHKGLRSENVILVAPRGCSTLSIYLQNQPYLVGYDYPRLDSVAAATYTRLPRDHPYADLYRHPLARGLSRLSYRKKLDLYALGCILLELCFWSRLVDLQSTWIGRRLQEEVVEAAKTQMHVELPSVLSFSAGKPQYSELAHCAGDSYANAVDLCLAPVQESDDSLHGGNEEVSLHTQKQVVMLLRRGGSKSDPTI